MIYVNNYVPTKYDIRLVLEISVIFLIFPETLYDNFLVQVDYIKNYNTALVSLSQQIIIYLDIDINLLPNMFRKLMKTLSWNWGIAVINRICYITVECVERCN